MAARNINPAYLNRAEELALQAVAEAPKRYQTYTSLGRLYMAPEKYKQGIEYFKQAIALNENFAEAHWNLAMAYILSHQPEQAEEALNKAVEKGFQVYAENNVDLIIQAFVDSQDLVATIDFIQKMTEPGFD